MDTITKKTESFKAWLEAKPYWEQYLWKLHTEKDALDEADIEKCYKYLLEDFDVIEKSSDRMPIVFPSLDLDSTEESGVKRTLDKIENLRNVNAIDVGCAIEFGKNLTIIYGDNGTGKSGIGRLLSNACLSRKPRRLLPNARIASFPAQGATADFHISDTSGSKIIKYTLGQTHEALKSFSVFDHESALIHLNSENKVELVPSKIKIFDNVFKSISATEEKLQKEIEIKRKDNPIEGLFTGASKITEFLNSLSYETTDKQIDDNLKFTQGDKTLLAKNKKEVAKKLKQDTLKQKKELLDECTDLNEFKNSLTSKSTSLTKTKITEINELLKEIKEKKEITNKLSVKIFDFAAFKNIGSAEWKSLIVAAEKLHEKETTSNGGAEPKNCVLCRQLLTDKEKTLFGEYWEYLKSSAETELATARHSLAESLDFLEKENVSWPSFFETEIAVKILKKDMPDDLKKIKASFNRLKTQLLEWVEHIKKEQNLAYNDPKINLDPITALIADKKKAEAKLVDPTSKIEILNSEVIYLGQKQQASRILSKIKKYAAWLRWGKAIEAINLPTVRGNVTRKKTEIMGELVISQYVDIFNKETEKLDCNFGLKVESHGRDATTVKELRLEFARGYNPSDILSEGEQTVSALADFLTEAKLDKNNSGIIFDDPVTSLDHLRKTVIVKRLIEEAKKRQVIILTHDIVFLCELQDQAKNYSIESVCCTLERNNSKVGIVKKKLPWNLQKVNARINNLKAQLPNLKAAENGDQDEYRTSIKSWYGKLYETWEVAIEEKLLNKVIQRYSIKIHPEAIDNIVIDDDIKRLIREGMSEANNWRHDQGTAVNRALPTNSKLEAGLEILENVISKCKPN